MYQKTLQHLTLLSLLCLLYPNVGQAQTELINERSMYAKVYERLDGKKESIIHGEPVHYFDGNAWEPIALTLSNVANGYENKTNPLQSFFPHQIAANEQLRFQLPSGETVLVDAQKSMVAYDNGSLSVLMSNATNANAVVAQNTVEYPNIYPGITDAYEVAAGRVKNEVRLASMPTVLNSLSAGYYGFKETIQLPSNYTIAFGSGATSGLVTDELLIKDAQGEVVLKFPTPVFVDNAGLGQAEDGAPMVLGAYLLEQNGTSIELSTLVPVNWLKDATRQYPVILDPTTTLTGMDGGWMSTNNLVNNPNYAFVGVCCGNLMHRAWIRFNTSSIPDGSCVLNTELELVSNGVGGATAEQTWVNDVTGAHGPYAGIITAVYADLGDGKYIDYIATGAGTHPFFPLGAVADADVQASLVGNFYQVALMFQNEPSTNWKRYVATSCRLRVTHDAPVDCVLLPVELSNFTTVCNNNSTDVTWTTASETNLDYFAIEKSEDGVQFVEIGTAKSAGNSTSPIQYQSTHTNLYSSIAYYRLKIVRLDGTVFYSDVNAVNCGKELGSVTIAPNPVKDKVQIEFVQHADANVQIILMNNLGKILEQIEVKAKTGLNQQSLDMSNLPKGVYLLTIKNGGQQAIRKVIKE